MIYFSFSLYLALLGAGDTKMNKFGPFPWITHSVEGDENVLLDLLQWNRINAITEVGKEGQGSAEEGETNSASLGRWLLSYVLKDYKEGGLSSRINRCKDMNSWKYLGIS